MPASEREQSWPLKAAAERRFFLARPGHCFEDVFRKLFPFPLFEKTKKLTGRFPDDEMVTSLREAAMAAAKSASSSSEVTRG